MKYAFKPMRVSYLGYIVGMILVMGFGWRGAGGGRCPDGKDFDGKLLVFVAVWQANRAL